jgi:hypothetical protein
VVLDEAPPTARASCTRCSGSRRSPRTRRRA